MGITISHRLKLNKIYIKDALDRVEELARELQKEQASKMGIAFEIRRTSAFELFVDIGGCETLSLKFKGKKEIESVEGWSYERATLTNDGKEPLDNGYEIEKYPQNEIYFASGFCKTQYAGSVLEHYWIAELIRKVAGYCTEARVNDEGDYYHSGKLEDAKHNIEDLGKMIGNIGGMLKKAGFEEGKIIKGGETTIKSNKKKK